MFVMVQRVSLALHEFLLTCFGMNAEGALQQVVDSFTDISHQAEGNSTAA